MSMRKIDEIIVHCSATPEGMEFGVKDIDFWHRQRGFKCIGYHYVVTLNGEIQCGRPIAEVGAHCLGHNVRSIGVCYVGGCGADGKTPKDTRTSAQKLALMALIRNLKTQFPKASVHGHREFANKACPCFDAASEYGKE